MRPLLQSCMISSRRVISIKQTSRFLCRNNRQLFTVPLRRPGRGATRAIWCVNFARRAARYSVTRTQVIFSYRRAVQHTDPSDEALNRGTAIRPKDRAHRGFLATDPKKPAGNLMIVDLLRNYIARICQPGSVKVPDLFKVKTYTTLHQMISLIKGQLRPDTTFSARNPTAKW